MKKNIKGFVIGASVATMLTTTVLGSGFEKTIDVFYNAIKVTVNGTKVDTDNILYKGTTYVPIRKVSEMLEKDVDWDQKNRIASINDKRIEAGETDVESLKDFAKDFVTTSYADFSDHSKSIEEFVDPSSKKLIEFVKDRKEILQLQSEILGRIYTPIFYDIKEIEVRDKEDNNIEILLNIDHKYLTNGSEALMGASYKVLINKSTDLKVIAVMSSDISATRLGVSHPWTQLEELDYSYQLENSTISKKPYDIEMKKDELKESLKEFQK